MSKKTKSAKCEKVCFVWVFAYYRKGRHVEKKNANVSKNEPKKNIDFSLKKQPKWTRKTNKNELATKHVKKAALGAHFCEKKTEIGWSLESLGRPLGGPWEGFWAKKIEAKKR